MATRPDNYPEWATNLENDPVTGAPNKVEPDAQFKASGLKRRSKAFRPFFNYQFDKIDEWVKYLDEALVEGNVGLSGGTASVTIPDQGGLDYRVMVTPLADVGSFWVTKDSATQFTINTSAGGSASVDWFLVNK